MANPNNTTFAKSLTRREAGSLAIIGAIAAATGSAVSATAASTTDPIIAAIENHRSAFLRSSETCRTMMALEVSGPDQSAAFIAAQDASAIAQHAARNAAIALIEIRPTTLAGVVALLAYVDGFNRGNVRLGDGGADYSGHELWPDELLDDGVKTMAGKTLEIPFAFWLLRNVQAALQSIAVQA